DCHLPFQMVEEAQFGWTSFLETFSSRDVAGEAVYSAIFESAPSLQGLFKTPRAVMSMRIMMGFNNIIMNLKSGRNVKQLVETLGFQHLNFEVTIPRVAIFRDAILNLMKSESGETLTNLGFEGIKRTLNFAGGGFVYVRTNYSERLRILSSSWRLVCGKQAESSEDAAGSGERSAEAEGSGEGSESSLLHKNEASDE
ncbi:unnamed protein product, partial [Polarella glacialis]